MASTASSTSSPACSSGPCRSHAANARLAAPASASAMIFAFIGQLRDKMTVSKALTCGPGSCAGADRACCGAELDSAWRVLRLTLQGTMQQAAFGQREGGCRYAVVGSDVLRGGDH